MKSLSLSAHLQVDPQDVDCVVPEGQPDLGRLRVPGQAPDHRVGPVSGAGEQVGQIFVGNLGSMISFWKFRLNSYLHKTSKFGPSTRSVGFLSSDQNLCFL
jgi:hypothetical protein